MHGRTAIRTALLQNLPAHRAELSTDRICRRPIGSHERPRINLVGPIGRTLRIWAKAPRRCRRHTSTCGLARRCLRCRQRNPELFRQLPNDRIVEFRPITLLKHRQSRLLTSNFCRNDALRKLRRTASILQLLTDFWTQIRHGHILWTLFLQLTRRNYQLYKQSYKHINNNINRC